MRRFQSNAHESPSVDPLSVSLTEQNTLIINFCEEEQPEDELVDSKEHLRSLYEDQKFNINYVDEPVQQSGTGARNHNKQINDLDMKITQCIDQSNKTHLKLDDLRKTLNILLHKIGIDEETPCNDIETNDSDGGGVETSSSKLDVVDSKISKCILSNKLLHLKIDNLQKSLDLILKNIESCLTDSGEASVAEESVAEASVAEQSVAGESVAATLEEQEIVFHFPISSVNELNKLDEQLQNNEDLMAKLIVKFSKIAGVSGNKSAKKIGVKIIERIISGKLLTKFTWTGRTNHSNKMKLPFIIYSSIFYLCLQVISKADQSFDSKACENFLKNNILKHSSMRLSRKFNRKLNRGKLNDETWCMKSKLVIDKSTTDSQSNKRQSVQFNVPETKHDDDEKETFAEEIVDSKANIVKLLDVQKETKNNPEVDKESNYCFLPNSFPTKCEHESKLDVMDIKISNCIESNTKVHSKIDNIQETLNIILNKIGKCQDIASKPPPAPTIPAEITTDNELELFSFPITKVLDLQDFNKKLSTIENFEEKMINKFISCAEDAKNISTQRLGLEVVESVISPQLLMKYSWTGRSKTLIKPKMAFMKYKYIVNFFQKIISKIDKRFTPIKCENFLRFTVFKHINMRVARQKRKINDPMSEFFSEQDDYKELNTSGLSTEDIPMETSGKELSLYKYEHDSAIEFCDANVDA